MLDIGGNKVTSVPLGLSPDQSAVAADVIASNETFYLPSQGRLVQFLNDMKEIKAKAPKKLEPTYKAFRELVTGVTVSDVETTKSEWAVTLKVGTAGGSQIDIPIFVSAKRHLIWSFAFDQNTPRKAMTGAHNSVVRDDTLFKQLLLRYAQGHADAIKANRMCFLYGPKCLNAGAGGVAALSGFVHDQRILIETDAGSLPADSHPHRPNGIHCYPTGFPNHAKDDNTLSAEVLQINEVQYEALVLLMLYVAETDQSNYLRVPFPTTKRFASHDQVSQDAYVKRIKGYEDTFAAALNALRKTLSTPANDPGAVLKALDTMVKAKTPLKQLRQPIGAALEALHQQLSEYGKVALAPKTPKLKTTAASLRPHLANLTDADIGWVLRFKPADVQKLREEIDEDAKIGSKDRPEVLVQQALKTQITAMKNATDEAVVKSLSDYLTLITTTYKELGRPLPNF